MTDIKILMSWLEGLAESDWRMFHSDSEVQTIAKETLALLKECEALIPRVMPLTNVMEWMGEIDELRDPVYWENRREQYESQWLLKAENPLYMINAIKAGVARVWTWKPTEEQSKAVKWDE